MNIYVAVEHAPRNWKVPCNVSSKKKRNFHPMPLPHVLKKSLIQMIHTTYKVNSSNVIILSFQSITSYHQNILENIWYYRYMTIICMYYNTRTIACDTSDQCKKLHYTHDRHYVYRWWTFKPNGYWKIASHWLEQCLKWIAHMYN